MATNNWSRAEVEAIVDDYLSMLASELAGTPYNKAAHRRALKPLLMGRSDQSIEFKHGNISAALIDIGFQYIEGYKRRSNYQALLSDVLSEQLANRPDLLALAAADAERPMAVPEVDDILAALVHKPPGSEKEAFKVSEPSPSVIRSPANFIEREARNRSLGSAGELFTLNFERARLIHAGKESLADRIEHTSKEAGDHMGFDIRSYEVDGADRLIEVKTTKYGIDTPFFVTRNEVDVSRKRASAYQVYRLFSFRVTPRLYALPGAIETSCRLAPATFLASHR